MQDNLLKIIILLLLGFVSKAYSQSAYDITYEDASYQFGAQAGPNGIGLFFRSAKPFKNGWSKAFDIALSGIRSVKEKSVLNQRMVNTSPYVFGKVNRLYALRPLLGFTKTLAEKNNKNSIGINFFVFTGPEFGFLKPVYVDIETVDPAFPSVIISQSVRYNPELHRHERISGYSSFGKGIDESKLLAGISFKSGVEFNWGFYSSEFKSIEIGVLIDYYPSRPKIMHYIKNKTIYSSFYLSFAFGKNY